MKYVTNSAEETIEIGKSFAEKLNKGAVVLLSGEMGAGKTVFVKGMAQGLGIKSLITSPTYAYMNDYDGILYHYDCYRLTSGEDAESLGLTDYFYAGGICVVEWSENIADVIPNGAIRVTIEKTGETQRSIEIEIPRD
ncbi:MAG: tRNA (adenosine(37)-N6)-threonylcarbamoyltransferase complex ATPase subunit type 1 TsaE [Candidatus Borkfalkiaceae bacterium]|nr:tRNA (adenosine(37)-N6)-threonylcarbamoyltransferase complex ATPase subunit type 1 TsaE [Christensenellaceae bacterium]